MSREQKRNPYRPGVGIKPPVLAGRENEIRRFNSALLNAPEIPANVRLTGLRGVGKTVLLSEFEAQAEELGWVTAKIEILERHNQNDAFAHALSVVAEHVQQRVSRMKKASSTARKFLKSAPKVEFSYHDVKVGLEVALGESAGDIPKVLFDTTETVVNAYRGGFILLLDEAQILRDNKSRDDHPLSQLLAAVSALQREGMPLGLVLCGLPTLASNLLAARTYSERMFRGEEIGRLSPEEAKDAFVRPIKEQGFLVNDSVTSRVLHEVDGYPYFIQLWGAELWEALRDTGQKSITTQLLDATLPSIYKRLDLDFCEPRVASLRPSEQDLLMLSASCPYPPLRVSDLTSRSSKRANNVNVIVGRLNEAGVIYRLRKGEYEYTAPQFHQFLQRRKNKIS